MRVDVLDHGFVRLVSYMQPASPQTGWTGDLEVVRNARVSHDADWRTGEDSGKDAGLLKYLYNNHHTSPFEAMVFTFEVQCPFFVARQWMRHRTWSYNEVSARYSELPAVYYVPKAEDIKHQSAKNKQGGADAMLNAGTLQQMFVNAEDDAAALYRTLLETGMARETARGILPMNWYTRFFATVDLHNLLHFMRLRSHEHAQMEIRVYSDAIKELVRPIVPTIMDVVDANP